MKRKTRTANCLQQTAYSTGFSLVEIMIVISILGIVMAGSFTAYTATQRNSRDARRQTDMENLRQALELYRADNGTYPVTGGGSWTNAVDLSGLLVPVYINKLPSDPRTGNPVYRYQATDLSSGRYYGYCVGAALESSSSAQLSCTPENGYNYGVKSP